MFTICSVFSKALEQYGDRPASIGECFVQHVSLELRECNLDVIFLFAF